MVRPVVPPIEEGATVVAHTVSSPSGRQASTAKTTPAKRAVKLKPKWQSKVGKGTFRTTMVFKDQALVIGTHGTSLDGSNESNDGVHVLDGKTGKETRLIATPGKGDLDVGGVAVDGDTVFFTTDNGQIVAASISTGKVVWTATRTGKIRPAPALGDLNGDKQVDVVVGDERGFLAAYDGASGKRLWEVGTGQNEYGAVGFVGSPAITDLDSDGDLEIIAGARDGVLTAYRGKTGKAIWTATDHSGIHASPVVLDLDGDGRKEILAAWSYSTLAIFDGTTGTQRAGQSIELDQGGIEGLFATPVPLPGPRSGTIVVGSSWWDGEDGITIANADSRLFRSTEGRVTSSAVVADLDGDGLQEAILVTEAGKVVSLTATGIRAELTTIAKGAETTPLLADLDGDGALELVVLGGDGVLSAFETGAKTTPVVSRFRGDDPHNTGEISVQMALELEPVTSAPVRRPRP
ncbi:MAG: PQQ-binding-like beta-propeller repeat protein [Polyangiaceae bacterium]